MTTVFDRLREIIDESIPSNRPSETKTQFIDGDRSARYPKREEYVHSGILFLNGESIHSGIINITAANLISEKKYNEIKKGRIAKNDILLTTRGNSVGNAAFVNIDDKGLINAQMLILRVDSTEISPKYLFYYLTTSTLRRYISNFASGSAQPQIPIRDLRKIPIQLPNIDAQKKIAAILSAYDELIENYQRRIVLLEKMVEEIYREWFVRLRFPGHKKVRVIKNVPEGWERTKILQLTSHLRRGVAPIYDDSAEGIAINQKCIRDDRLDISFARRQSRDVTSDRHVQFGDVLVNSTGEGTLGRVAQVLTFIPNCIVDSHVTIVRPKIGVSICYFGMTVKAWEPHFSVMGHGATNQTELPPSVIGGIEILMPSKVLQDQFELYAAPIFSQITSLTAQSIFLTQARNAILPRLISGKLSVENLDIHQPPSMQNEHLPHGN